MKNKKYNIEEEIRKTMDTVENIQRVEGNPYLSTRLNERLHQKNITTHSQVPIWQLAMVFCLFFLNGFALIQSGYFDSESNVAVEETVEENWLVNSEEDDLNYISWND